MKLRKYVSTELYKLRVNSKETQSQLAKSIESNKDTICRYEKGNCEMKLETIEKILDHYGVSFYIFFKNYNA